MTITPIISLVISITGAFLGALSFYLTQVRKSKITVVVEKRVRIGYCDGGEGFQFYVPVTFINATHQTGIIKKIQMTIFSTSTPGIIYKIDLARFSKIDEQSNRILDNELPHAIAINGKSSLHKLLRFSWWNSSVPKLVLNKPSYVLTFNFWTTNKSKPIRIEYRLDLDRSALLELENYRAKKSGTAIEVPLDGESPNNELVRKK